MFRLFQRLLPQETKVTTWLSYHCDMYDEFKYSNSEYTPCSNANEFGCVYELINLEIDTIQSKLREKLSISIKLLGKLNGNKLNEEFKDLESYRKFLEDNALIFPMVLKTWN